MKQPRLIQYKGRPKPEPVVDIPYVEEPVERRYLFRYGSEANGHRTHRLWQANEAKAFMQTLLNSGYSYIQATVVLYRPSSVKKSDTLTIMDTNVSREVNWGLLE